MSDIRIVGFLNPTEAMADDSTTCSAAYLSDLSCWRKYVFGYSATERTDWVFGVFGQVVQDAISSKDTQGIWSFLELLRKGKDDSITFSRYGTTFGTIVEHIDENQAIITQFGPCNSLQINNPLTVITFSHRNRAHWNIQSVTQRYSDDYCIARTVVPASMDFIITQGHIIPLEEEFIPRKGCVVTTEYIDSRLAHRNVNVRKMGFVKTSDFVGTGEDTAYVSPIIPKLPLPVQGKLQKTLPKSARPPLPDRGRRTPLQERKFVRRSVGAALGLIGIAVLLAWTRGETEDQTQVIPLTPPPAVIRTCTTFGTDDLQLNVRRDDEIDPGNVIKTIPDGTLVEYTRIIEGEHPFLEVNPASVGIEGQEAVFVSALHCKNTGQ